MTLLERRRAASVKAAETRARMAQTRLEARAQAIVGAAVPGSARGDFTVAEILDRLRRADRAKGETSWL